MSSELDLLRPFSRSLAARAEGKESAEARAASLEAEVETLRGQLAAAVESAEKLGSRAGTAEDEAGASASKLSGLEKVVRRLGGEAEVCFSRGLFGWRAMSAFGEQGGGGGRGYSSSSSTHLLITLVMRYDH